MDLHITRLKGSSEIQTDSGQVYTGTICLHETSVHVYRNNHEIPRDGEHMEIVSMKTTSDQETRDLGIEGRFCKF